MTEKETVEVVTLIVASYPASERFKDAQTVRAMTKVWARIFKDDPSELVQLAVSQHISTNAWPPSIAEIRERMVRIAHPEIVPPDVAWAAVTDLFFAFGEFDHDDASKKLPPLVARCVEILGYSNLCEMHRYKHDSARAAFFAQYTPMYNRAKETAMTPEKLTKSISTALGHDSENQLEAPLAARRKKEAELDAIFERNKINLIGEKNNVDITPS